MNIQPANRGFSVLTWGELVPTRASKNAAQCAASQRAMYTVSAALYGCEPGGTLI